MANMKSHMYIYFLVYRDTKALMPLKADYKQADLATHLVSKMQRYEGHLAETKCHQFSLPI